MKLTYTNLLKCMTGLGLMLAVSASLAKPLSLYEQPQTTSKVVGSVDPAVGVMTIFTPKNSAWTKVADPRNGNVGWVKSSDLGSANVSFNVMTRGSGAQGVRFYQYGGSRSYSSQEMQREYKRMIMRQRAIQANMQHVMQDMFESFYFPSPMFVPVVYVPVTQAQAKVPAKAPAKMVTEGKLESGGAVKAVAPVKSAEVKQ